MKICYYYRLAIKILIPVAFFVIANLEGNLLGNVIAGVMTMLVLYYYILVWQKIGDKKE